MLLHKIVERVQTEVDDLAYWTSARITGLANDAVENIVSELDVKVQYYREFNTEESRQNYDTPLEYIANVGLYYNSGHNRVIVTEDSPMNIYGVVTNALTEGNPTHGFVYAVSDLPELHLHPVPDAVYAMQWWFIGWAPELVNDNDETMIPRFLHKYVVDYVKNRIKVGDKEMSEPVFRGLWKDDIRTMRRAIGKRKLHKRDDQLASGKKMFPNTGGTSAEVFFRLSSAGSDDVIW